MWAAELDPDGLSQGDVVEDLYFANVYPLAPAITHSVNGKSGWLASPWREDENGVCSVVARARKGLGLVLSHSCDIDKKNKKSRVFAALVDRLSRLNEEEQRKVLGQERIALFPLVGTSRGNLYADLRLAMALDPRLFVTDAPSPSG